MQILIEVTGEEIDRCGRCPCFHYEYPVHCRAVRADTDKKIGAPYAPGRPDWCPLVELPEGHGRLVDADAIIAKYGDYYVEEGTEEGMIGDLRMLLELVPTVVEKEVDS